MKRAAMLYCADVNVQRYKVLKQRDQLPFYEAKSGDGWQSFSRDDAFRLRMMMDLIGGKTGADSRRSWPPQTAASVVNGAVSQYHDLRGELVLEDFAKADWWGGALVFEQMAPSGSYDFTQWFLGPLESIAECQRDVVDKARAWDEPEVRPIGAFIVNASNAARFVLERAAEIGAEDAD